MDGWLEGRFLAGEVGDEALLRFAIEALDVALLAGLEGAFDVDFEEVFRADDLAGELAERFLGRDEGVEADEAGLEEELGDFGDAADVFLAVGVGETEAPVEAVAEVPVVQLATKYGP